AIVSVAAISVASDVQKASDAVRSHSLATLSADAANLVHQLQSERGVAATYLSESAPEAQSGIPEAAKATDAAREKYQQSREGVSGLPATFDSLLKRIDEQVAGLPKLRDDITKRQVALSGAVFRYKVLIEDLLGIRASATQLSGDATLSDRMRSAGALSAAKEQTAQERIVVLRATTATAFTQALQREFIATLTGWQEAMSAFYSTATPEQQRNLEETLTGSEIRQAQRIEGDVITAEVNKPLQIQSVDWNQSMSGKLAKMRAVEQSLDRDTIGEAASLRDAERQQVFVQAGLVLATLLVALLVALVVARAMARSLRDLREGALGVAQHGLPQAVARLRDPAVVSQLTPEEVAGRLAEPLDVRGRDEFGQVATAFNAVHREAVRTAAEQAALRS